MFTWCELEVLALKYPRALLAGDGYAVNGSRSTPFEKLRQMRTYVHVHAAA